MKAIIACLADRLTMPQIARLTDRQILEIYWHKRDKNGEIEIPPLHEAEAEGIPEEPAREATFEEEMARLEFLGKALQLPPGNLADARDKLRAKFGRGTATPEPVA